MSNSTTMPSPLAGPEIEHAESLMTQAEIELMAQDDAPIDIEEDEDSEEKSSTEEAQLEEQLSDSIAIDEDVEQAAIFSSLSDASGPMLDSSIFSSFSARSDQSIDEQPPADPAPKPERLDSPLAAIPEDSIGYNAKPEQRNGLTIAMPSVSGLAKAAKQWVGSAQSRVSLNQVEKYHLALKEFDNSRRDVLEHATAIEQGPLGAARDSFRKQGIEPDLKVLSDMLDHPVVHRQLDTYERSMESLEVAARNVMKAGMKAGVEPDTLNDTLKETFDELQEDLKKKLDELWDKIGRPLAEFAERIAQRLAAVINALLRGGAGHGPSMG